jgi:Tectonin domain
MKKNKSWNKLLPVAALSCAVIAGSSSYAKPAYSCSWTDPLSCFIGGGGVTPTPTPDIKGWIFNGADGIGNWFKNLGKGIGQFAVRDVWGNLITTFSCPFSTYGAYGTTMACFSSGAMETNRVLGALDFIANDNRNDFTYVTMSGGTPVTHSFAPASFSIGRIAYIMNGYASEASLFNLYSQDANADASTIFVQTGTSAPVSVWPSAYQNYTTNAGLAGTLVHEADHTRFGSHTCGSAADTYEDGPYGTEIQYLARIWRTGHPAFTLPALDRDLAWDKAVAKIGQLCDPGAQQRVWNKYLIDAPYGTGNPVLTAAATTWQLAAGSSVTDISVAWDGRIYGVGGDGAVYLTPSAGGAWIQATVPYVTHISVTPLGYIYGIGGDGAVYVSSGVRYSGGSYVPGTWAQVATPWVQQISVPSDNYIYGLGGDYAVYRTAPGGAWAQVAPPWVQSISVTPDGTIYGVGGDNAVYRTTPNSWSWEQVATPSVSSISVTPDGFIYGVGTDNAVYVTRSGSTWQGAASPWVSKVSVTPDGMIYGLGGDAVYAHSSLR